MAAKEQNSAAVRKRAQIAKANRTMFIWIAVSAAVIGIAGVVVYQLAQTLVYNEKVLAEKANTASILEKNVAAAPELETQVRILDTNEALASAKANEDDQVLQVILDALPSEANSLALGASLQNRLLTGIDGLTLETLQIDPVIGVESLNSGVVDASGAVTSANAITFRFSVTGAEPALKAVLVNLEKSIRQIDIQSIRIEGQAEGQLMSVVATAYFEPAVVLELTEKAVPR